MKTDKSAFAGAHGTQEGALEQGLAESLELSFHDAILEDIVTQRVGRGASPEQREAARREVLAQETAFLRRFAEKIWRELAEETKKQAREVRVG